MEQRISDEQYMQRALDLAANGRGAVSTNPMVGCVIVHQQSIVGEGWHMKFGGPHAEVNAIHSVSDRQLLKDSTLYVSLEPCSHHGKTPPCADLLIREQLKKVVIANMDPNPLVSGTGIKKLREAGIEVITRVLVNEGYELNKRFFTFMQHKRPYIILKWAQTSDGCIARENFDSKWISNEISRQFVHKWRSEEDAILVGSNTALHDNPQLNVRDWKGKDPIRIVLDLSLKLPLSLNVFDGKLPTIVYNHHKEATNGLLEYVRIPSVNFAASVIDDLYKREIQSVLVEGGAHVLSTFIMSGLWDEARIFTSATTFGRGIAAPSIQGKLISEDRILSDVLRIYVRYPVIGENTY